MRNRNYVQHHLIAWIPIVPPPFLYGQVGVRTHALLDKCIQQAMGVNNMGMSFKFSTHRLTETDNFNLYNISLAQILINTGYELYKAVFWRSDIESDTLKCTIRSSQSGSAEIPLKKDFPLIIESGSITTPIITDMQHPTIYASVEIDAELHCIFFYSKKPDLTNPYPR
jgi:hypothetical protein